MFLWTRPFLIFLALAALGLPPATAQASTGFPTGSHCHRLAPASADPARLARSRVDWDCSPRDWAIQGSQASLVRIDMTGRPLPANAVLSTRLTLFRSLSITALGPDGAARTRTITPDDLTFSTSKWTMRMPLPRLSGPVEAYVLKVTGARHAGMLSDAVIGLPPSEARVGNQQLILAALCGLMLMPLLLNFAFYRILRERFILWHGAAVLAMLTQTLVSSGLVNRFAQLSSTTLCALSTISWACMVVATVRFFIDLIEPEILGRRQRLALEALCPWFLFWSGYYLFADGPFLASVAPLYYLSFLPIIVVLVSIVVLAAMRGSRLVWFQIVGWAPLMALGIVRIISILGFTDAPLGLMVEQHAAIVFEVIVTALGAADRIMRIRLQRDQAVAEAKANANLALHDPLTGLLNRRAIEQQFENLYRAGYRTMAAIDLDHFKAINDTHGHAAGDSVLQAVALALRPDQNTIAVRMGGEEFLLLLRGGDALERAERRRQAIPSRIAKQYPGLSRLVTASMGVFTHSAPCERPPDFHDLYEPCDRLLYEAKSSGRNRITSNEPLDGMIEKLELAS